MVLAMLVKPNRLKPKTTTLRVLQGIFFFNAVVINTDYCVAKCCKKTLTTGKESVTALRCKLADPGGGGGGLSGREIRRRKFSRTVERAPGMPLLTTQFHDSFQRLSLIGHKIYFYAQRRLASIAAFMVSPTLARQVQRTVEFSGKLLGIRRSRKQHERCWPPLGHKNIHFLDYWGLNLANFG